VQVVQLTALLAVAQFAPLGRPIVQTPLEMGGDPSLGLWRASAESGIVPDTAPASYKNLLRALIRRRSVPHKCRPFTLSA